MTATYSRILGGFNESYINEVEINGSSCSFEFTFSGTITAAGAATNFKVAIISGSGSAALTGGISYHKLRNIIGAGLLQASGTGLFKEIIYVTGSGSMSITGTGGQHKHHEVIGSGLLVLTSTSSVVLVSKVQIMHTDRTLYIPEDIREVWVAFDEERTLEIETEYREIDVPAEVSYY